MDDLHTSLGFVDLQDRQHAESSSQLADCCICLSPMITDLEALPCAHVFHERCFRKALRSKQRCPLCQLDVASASSADVSGLQALQAQHLQGRILRTLAPNGSLRGVLEPLDRHIQTVPAHVPASADHVHASADHVHANADHDHISHNAVHGFVCMGLLCVMFYVVLAVVSTHTPQLIPDLPGSVLQFLKLTLRFGFAGSIMVLSAIYVMLVIPY